MKKFTFSLVVVFCSIFAQAQQEQAIATETTLVTPQITYGTFTDPRDNQTYRTVEMPDGKTWMAENLNYRDPDWRFNDFKKKIRMRGTMGSWCHGNNPDNCNTYGRLYTWAAAREACPAGWHLPSSEEWYALAIAVGGKETEQLSQTRGVSTGTALLIGGVVGVALLTSATQGNTNVTIAIDSAGTILKSQTGWHEGRNHKPATNDFGFSALPGNRRMVDGHFGRLGLEGFWWSDMRNQYHLGADAHFWGMEFNYEYVRVGWSNKNVGFSVRCVKD